MDDVAGGDHLVAVRRRAHDELAVAGDVDRDTFQHVGARSTRTRRPSVASRAR